jgi:hypothetical protein
VRNRSLKSSLAALIIVGLSNIVPAEDSSNLKGLTKLEKAVVLAVQLESTVSDLARRNDVCVALGSGLEASEEKIVSNLKHKGLKLHENRWCNNGQRGVRVAAISPVKETSPGTYEIVLQTDDLWPLQRGEHFATLLKRGTYVVHCEEGSGPQLISYQQSCCSKASS